MIIFGSAKIALAIAKRCLCPPDNFTPLSPINVSKPLSNLSVNSFTYAAFTAFCNSSSVALGLGNNMFALIVPSNKNSSCKTTPKYLR